jgi:hypothetical protein
MLRPVRGSSTLSHGARWLQVLSISITGALLATTSASAAAADSAATPGSSAPRYVPRASATQAATTPSSKAYRLHLHGGLFAPVDVNATSPTLGLRLGRRLVSHVQAGLLVGWTFQRKNLEQPVNGLPGLQPQRILARVDGQLVPAMAYIQVDLNESRFLVPYVGIATGYEWFKLKANDYRTGETAAATYANYAWESWGGLGLRLGPDMTFDSELFYNGGSLERDVTDSSGQSYSETVHANGVGARVGVNFLF